MKARTLAAAAFVAVALVASAGSGQSKGILPLTLRPAPPANPPLGITFGRLDTRLTRLDPRTLLPRGRGVSLERFSGAWSFAPDRRQLVFGSAYSPLSESPAALRFFDVATLRPLRDLVLGPSAYIQVLDWVAPERLLVVMRSCCPAAWSVSLLDPADGTVLARHPLEGELAAARRARGGLVLLREPASLGPVSLAVAGADGTVRSVVLDQIQAGVSMSPAPLSYLGEDRAGLAVDPVGGHAYALAASGPIADVDLASLGVTYHSLARPVSLLGRLRDWLEPSAQAKGPTERSTRPGVWLGDGRLAVFGRNTTAYSSNGRLDVRIRPSGLTVIDTRSWTSQMLDPRSAWAVVARDALLSFGSTWDSGKQQEIGSGLRVYGRDGAMRLQLFGKRVIGPVEVFGARAFVHRSSPESDYQIVNLTTGRVLRTIHRDLPVVLRGAGSGY